MTKLLKHFFSCLFLGFKFHHYNILTLRLNQSSQNLVSSTPERLQKNLLNNDSKTSKKKPDNSAILWCRDESATLFT